MSSRFLQTKFLMIMMAILAAGCSGVSQAPATAGVLAERVVDQSTAAANDTRQDSRPTAQTTSRRGAILFLQCRSCHSVNEGGPHLVGPNLHGLFGAVAGKKSGFGYSAVFAESDTVWTEETLDGFLKKPSDYFPGTRMAFIGLANAEDRAALIAHLKTLTE